MFSLYHNIIFKIYRNVLFRIYHNLSFKIYRNVLFRIYRNVLFRIYHNIIFRICRNLIFKICCNAKIRNTCSDKGKIRQATNISGKRQIIRQTSNISGRHQITRKKTATLVTVSCLYAFHTIKNIMHLKSRTPTAIRELPHADRLSDVFACRPPFRRFRASVDILTFSCAGFAFIGLLADITIPQEYKLNSPGECPR